MIGEAEVSSYNAMSACKSTFESSGVGVQFNAYDMVWTAWNAEWACQKEPFEVIHLGDEAFLWFGSYVTSYGSDVIWEYVVLDISGWWDCTTMIWYGNESVSICLLALAIGIHSIWLHHMYWCGVLGEDYDGFICVMDSNLFLLTQMIMVSLCFPKFSQWGF